MEKPFHIDYFLLFTVFAIIGLGVVMVASASMVISDREYGYPFHFFLRQILYLGLGIGVGYALLYMPLKFLEALSPYLIMVSFSLLLLVLIPHIGHEVNGSRRWIVLGPLSLQVSELVKACVIIFMAGYLVRREKEVCTRISGFLKPMMLLACVGGLLLLEPDFGAAVVITVTVLGLMFLAGVQLRQFLLLLTSVGLVLGLIAIAAPYRLTRLVTFLHPWEHQYGSGYQLTQSLIAFGRGGFAGVGLGNSIQKLFYLPEAHTDFLFAVLAEELGLIGTLLVIGLFALLVGRLVQIGYKAYRRGALFSSYLAFGFSFWIGLQAMVNIGVNAGVLPTKGLTLPLMSYGGSSILVNCMVFAIALRIAHDNYQELPRESRT